MPSKSLLTFALVLLSSAAFALAADEKAKPKVTFETVSAIFQAKCNSCHNADKAKGGLNLATYSTAMAGGASGAVVEAGDADGSRLYELVTHAGEPKMPPMQPKLPDAELAVIKAWIEAGAPDRGLWRRHTGFADRSPWA